MSLVCYQTDVDVDERKPTNQEHRKNDGKYSSRFLFVARPVSGIVTFARPFLISHHKTMYHP